MGMNRFIGALVCASIGMVAHADPFTYQGQLNDEGHPANGAYDLVFQLMDAPVGGSIVGLAVNLEDVDVIDGLFQVEIDFNTTFDGSDRWINVLVRDGASTGVYDQLSPRQPLTATPEAQHAKVADTALNAPWVVAPGVIVYGGGDDKVFINRSNSITAAEYFGVHGESTGFVGMYISGPADSDPFYGYSVNNSVNAYTFYDSGSSEWRLVNNSSTVLVAEDSGDIRITNDVQADSFEFDAPKTRRVAVSGDVFRPWSSTVPYFSFRTGSTGAYVATASNDWMIAPITFPDGATLTKMTVYCTDTAPGDLIIRLNERGHNDLFAPAVFNISTSGLNGATLELVDSTPVPGREVINYATHHYSLFVQGSIWPGNDTMVIGSVVIEYTIDEAN